MFPALLLFTSLVNDVRTFIARHDLATADREVREYQQKSGPTPELAAALSFLGRGALEAKNYALADQYSAETRTVAGALLGARRLDAEPWLPLAVGAAIEVHAGVLAARGERPEAVAFLRGELKTFGNTSIGERIRKNVNLLNMEGKPAPELDTADWLGAKPPSLASLKGHPVLLFFWAHWCGDCKGEVPIIADLQRKYAAKGLELIGPTKLYGYIGGGDDAAPAAEKQYIEQVRRAFYSALPTMPVPLSAANFLTYGASTTPTIVLIDRKGIVRFYHPGALSETELATRIEGVLKP